MSSGGLLQLVAYGSQDVYITGTPEITFFRVVYRRHTNFAMESMEQTFSGNADFGRKVSCLVARNGDLIHKGYLEIDLPALTANSSHTVCWTRNIGHVIIDEMSVEIGGAIIDKHYGMWLTIYNELTQVSEKEDGYNVMIGNTASLTTPASSIPATSVIVPLIFWFNRNPGLALPLIALMYHDVKINITFRPAVECYVTSDNLPLTNVPSLQNVALYLDYIFLDAPERRMFSQMNHEYLIEQLQANGGQSYSNSSVRQLLNFSHPTKEIVWVIQPDANVTGQLNRWVDFTDNGTGSNPYGGNDPLVDCKIQLNTHDRTTSRGANYWNLLQPYNHHTRIPSTGIYVYSFALEPEKHQPSGSINMSRIENCTLNMTLSTGTSAVRIYPFGVNYNVLRITSGMGGLLSKNSCAESTYAAHTEKKMGPKSITKSTSEHCWFKKGCRLGEFMKFDTQVLVECM